MTLAARISGLLDAHPAGLTVSEITLALGVRRQTVAEAVDALGYPPVEPGTPSPFAASVVRHRQCVRCHSLLAGAVCHSCGMSHDGLGSAA